MPNDQIWLFGPRLPKNDNFRKYFFTPESPYPYALKKALNDYQIVIFHQDTAKTVLFWGQKCPIPKYGYLGPDPRKMKISKITFFIRCALSIRFQQALNGYQMIILSQQYMNLFRYFPFWAHCPQVKNLNFLI